MVRAQVGQGALALEVRDDDEATTRRSLALNDDEALSRRSRGTGISSRTGCRMFGPAGAYADVSRATIVTLSGVMLSRRRIAKACAPASTGSDAAALGRELAGHAARRTGGGALRGWGAFIVNVVLTREAGKNDSLDEWLPEGAIGHRGAAHDDTSFERPR